MQSLPANADATSVSPPRRISHIGPTRRVSQVKVLVHQLTQSQMVSQGHRLKQPSIGHQAVIVGGSLDAVGVVAW